MRKHLFWLICVYEQANLGQIDWRAMSLRDMARLVPDETEQLQKIGWEVPVVAVSQCLGTHPMMVSCQLCLTRRVLNEPKMLQIFSDACNQEKLAQLKQHHVDAYGIPPSPWQLARDFEIAASKETASQSVSVGVRRKRRAASSAPGGELQDAELVGHSASSAFADLGSDSHAQRPASVATGSGIKRQRGAALPLASGERAALPLASGEHVEQGKEGQAEEKPHQWYHIESTGDKKHRCKCKGNCSSECPARKARCPNPAT